MACVAIAGISYCQPCLDAGRFRQPTFQTVGPEDCLPMPLGPVTSSSRLYITVGIVGLIIVAISIHLVWLAPIIGSFLFLPMGQPNLLIFLPRTIGLALVATGFSLAGLAFGEFQNYFNYKYGSYISLYTLISPWILFFGHCLVYTGYVYDSTVSQWYWPPGPLAPLFNGLFILGSALYGVLFILGSVALLAVRRESLAPSATKWASALFLIVAHILLFSVPILIILSPSMRGGIPYGYSFYIVLFPGLGAFDLWQAALIEPAVLVTAYIMNRLRSSLKSSGAEKSVGHAV